ncbi:MAG: regulatory protein RecX [Acidobacteriota bacterium]
MSKAQESAEDSARACFQKAVDLLSRRPHFRAQLETKLRARRFDDEEIATALDRLEELGYLNDLQTAADYVARKVERAPIGSRRLRAELVQRGAASAAIDHALADHRDDLPTVRAAARRWVAKAGPRKADVQDRDPRKLARFLERQGFPGHAIFEVVREWESDSL